MKKFFIAGLIVLAIMTAWYYTRHPLGKKAVINGHTIRLELAITSAEKERGLGYRDTLATDSGMLFVYQNINHQKSHACMILEIILINCLKIKKAK